MTDDQTAPEKSFRLMYRSRIQIPVEDRRVELGALFSKARSNNKKRGITGALLLSDEHFVQTSKATSRSSAGCSPGSSGTPATTPWSW